MLKFLAAGLLLGSVLSASGFSQSTNATLGGTVQDPTKALIPGVAITAKNAGTGTVTHTVTNEVGAYQFPSLQPGTYDIEATLPGFKTAITKGLQLSAADQVKLNIPMEIGSPSATVDVKAAVGTSSSNSVGTVWPEILDLPSANRDVMSLLGYTPGIQSGVFAEQ